MKGAVRGTHIQLKSSRTPAGREPDRARDPSPPLSCVSLESKKQTDGSNQRRACYRQPLVTARMWSCGFLWLEGTLTKQSEVSYATFTGVSSLKMTKVASELRKDYFCLMPSTLPEHTSSGDTYRTKNKPPHYKVLFFKKSVFEIISFK